MELLDEGECVVYAVLVHVIAAGEGDLPQALLHSLIVVLEEIESVFEGQDDKVAVFRPVDILGSGVDVDSAHYVELVPVVEGDEVLGLDGEESASEDALVGVVCLECLVLLEVLEYLHCASIVVLDSIHVLVHIDSRPYQVVPLPECRILELRILVHHEIIIPANGEESSRWRELY